MRTIITGVLVSVLAVITVGCASEAHRGRLVKATLNEDANAAFVKNVHASPDEGDPYVGMSVSIHVSPPTGSAPGTGAPQRAVGITATFNYGGVITSTHTTLRLVDTSLAEAIEFGGGGDNPEEARAIAMSLLGLPDTTDPGTSRPRLRLTLRPVAGRTWGTAANREHLELSWKPRT